MSEQTELILSIVRMVGSVVTLACLIVVIVYLRRVQKLLDKR